MILQPKMVARFRTMANAAAKHSQLKSGIDRRSPSFSSYRGTDVGQSVKGLQESAATGHLILIVDDDANARRQLRILLAANGYSVIEAGNGRIARALLAENAIDLVISDIFMPECDGFELIAAIRGMDRSVPVIAMSDHESWTGLNFLDAANDLGAAAVIEKPFRATAILRLVGEATAGVARDSRIVALSAWAEPQRSRIPTGLEWLGGPPAE